MKGEGASANTNFGTQGSGHPSVAEIDQALGERYEVLELLGTGGMGAVFKALQPRLNRFVAIKVLTMAATGSQETDEFDRGELFEQEARAMAALSHPGIVAVHEFGTTSDGLHFIVMEYVDGADLQTVMRIDPLSPNCAFAWINQICSALSYAHAQGMIHRDIKPANILIDRNGSAKVADFGLAQMTVGDSTGRPADSAIAGTPDFVAPEVLDSRVDADHRADVYSLGALIYQMLTGKSPRGLWELPSALVPSLDERFDGLVDRALQADPDLRYQNMTELESDLTKITFSSPQGEVATPALSEPKLRAKLAGVFFAMLAAQLVGTMFNIWYNIEHIGSFLSREAGAVTEFITAIARYNFLAYPPLIIFWAFLVFRLRTLPRHGDAAKRRVINLPIWAVGISATGWLLSIPAVLLQLDGAPLQIYFHLPISVGIGAAIAISLGFLSVDLLCQKWLYPQFFTWDERLWKIPGTLPMSLTGRGLCWTISAAVCPIIAMLLLIVSVTENSHVRWFAVAVSLVCIACGLVGAWLMGRLILQPVDQLRRAAQQIGEGDLDSRVEILRADELGILGHEFNRMSAKLRESEHVRQTLGRAVGQDLADQFFDRPGRREIVEREIGVLAVGIKNFDSLRSDLAPDVLLELLDFYHDWLAAVFRDQRGSVFQRVEDQAIVLFGTSEQSDGHAVSAIWAAQALIEHQGALQRHLQQAGSATTPDQGALRLELGIGIDSGTATLSFSGSVSRPYIGACGEVIQTAQANALISQSGDTPIIISRAAFLAAENVLPMNRLAGEQYDQGATQDPLYTL